MYTYIAACSQNSPTWSTEILDSHRYKCMSVPVCVYVHVCVYTQKQNGNFKYPWKMAHVNSFTSIQNYTRFC